jgi:excisionase family DNA binding protein
MNPLPSFYTPDEVAASLRVTRRTVYNWLASGALTGARTGGVWRISQMQIDAFLSSVGRVAPPPEPEPSVSKSAGRGKKGRRH